MHLVELAVTLVALQLTEVSVICSMRYTEIMLSDYGQQSSTQRGSAIENQTGNRQPLRVERVTSTKDDREQNNKTVHRHICITLLFLRTVESSVALISLSYFFFIYKTIY